MKDSGWTLADLDGELAARGERLEDLSNYEVQRAIQNETAAEAAQQLAEYDY